MFWLPGPWAQPVGPGSFVSAGFALRVEWSDLTHTVECYGTDFERVSRQSDAMARYWGGGPISVTECRVIPILAREFDQHRRLGHCRLGECAGEREPHDDRIVAGYALREEWFSGHTYAWFTDDAHDARAWARRNYWHRKLQKHRGHTVPVGLILVRATEAMYLRHEELGRPCARRECRALPATIWHPRRDVAGRGRVRQL